MNAVVLKWSTVSPWTSSDDRGCHRHPDDEAVNPTFDLNSSIKSDHIIETFVMVAFHTSTGTTSFSQSFLVLPVHKAAQPRRHKGCRACCHDDRQVRQGCA